MRRVKRDNDRLAKLDEIIESGRRPSRRFSRRSSCATRSPASQGSRQAPVDVDLISPLVLANETGEEVSELLAGEHLGDFSGFLEEEFRRSDFALGYECSLIWARDCLGRYDLDRGVVERSIRPIEDGRLYDWSEVRRGSSDTGDLSIRSRMRLGRMVSRAVRALKADEYGGCVKLTGRALLLAATLAFLAGPALTSGAATAMKPSRSFIARNHRAGSGRDHPDASQDGVTPAADLEVTELTGFTSPTGNIGCVIDRATVRCDIGKRDWKSAPRRHRAASSTTARASSSTRAGHPNSSARAIRRSAPAIRFRTAIDRRGTAALRERRVGDHLQRYRDRPRLHAFEESYELR